MKKILTTLLLALAGCVTAMAGDTFKVSSGSLKPLKNGGRATVVIDMTQTTFDKKMPLRQESRYAHVDDQLANFTAEFIREFNENSKSFLLQEEEAADTYRIRVIVDDLDVHVTLFSFKGGIATVIAGKIEITDAAGGHVATIDYEFESSSMTYDISLEETFEVLAKTLAKRINKGN